MKIVEKLLDVQESFRSHGIADSHTEASLVIATAVGESRTDLYANLYEEIPERSLRAVDNLVHRRLHREPMAYILGNREFYGLQLELSRGVFIPRPETELLVDLAIDRIRNLTVAVSPTIVEVGTGSGAISVAIASNLRGVSLCATDISNVALTLAQRNAAAHEVAETVNFVRSDLLSCFIGKIDVLIGNLPYLRSSIIPSLDPEIYLHEPMEALDGGTDGCSFIKRMLDQAAGLLANDATILLEMDPEQFTGIIEHARHIWSTAQFSRHPDLSGSDRILEISLNSRSNLHNDL